MSISSLTTRAASRHLRAVHETAEQPAATEAERRAAEAESRELVDSTRVARGLSALTRFIPTEVITLYVGFVSATPAIKDLNLVEQPHQVPTYLYWLSLLLVTPAVFLGMYLLKVVAVQKQAKVPPRLPELRTWPWWPLAAAMIAFAIWALAVPTEPALLPGKRESLGVVLAILAAVVSGCLAAVDRFLRDMGWVGD